MPHEGEDKKSPWEVSKPVRSTTARQPLSGVRMRALLSPVCCRILVPLNSMWFLSRLMLRRDSGSTCVAWQQGLTLHCPLVQNILCHSTKGNKHTQQVQQTLATSKPSWAAAALVEPVPMGFFHWGVDSPVSTASSTMHVPAKSSASAGTTRSSCPTPANQGEHINTNHSGPRHTLAMLKASATCRWKQ